MVHWLEAFKPVRRHPRLWIETMWLVESREPFLVTRTIPLHQGLNIVWAKEAISPQKSGLASAGHGVGKTSLCLLMRYILGDDATAISELRQKAATGFPKGGVAAKVHIEGATWLVFRPYGAYSHSLASRNAELEQLLQGDGDNEYQLYLHALEEFSIGRLAARSLPGTNKPLQWQHLLAWCIRAQRTRFDGFYHWRDGDGLNFSRPRRDPPIFVSSVLGLLDAELNQLLSDIEAKQSEFDTKKEKIPELERAPAYALAHSQQRLRNRVRAGENEPLFKSLLDDSVESRVEDVQKSAVASEATLERETQQAEEILAQMQLELVQLNKKLELAKVEAGIAKSLVDANRADFDRLTNVREGLERLAGEKCDHGQVEYTECEHIKKRKSSINLNWVRDAKEVQANAPDRARKLAQRQSDQKRFEDEILSLTTKIKNQKAALRRLNVRIATSETSRSSLKELWDEVQLLLSQKESRSESPELIAARKLLQVLEGQLQGLRTTLHARQSRQSVRVKAIKSLTACVSARFLGVEGHARFVQDDEVRPFEIARDGEAYQVLEVLLGDIVCLLDAATSEASSHPGFVVHDCPREADMSDVLYREFFLSAAEAATQFGNNGAVPFQFIVTTTSPPPDELQGDSYVVLELEPGSEDSLLFRRRLKPELPWMS